MANYPKVVVTYKLRSYGAATKEIGNGHNQETGRWRKHGRELAPAVSMTREGDTDDFAAY